MKDYISREGLIAQIESTYCTPCKKEKCDYNGARCRACQYGDEIDDVADFPTADVVEVRHGTWKRAGLTLPTPEYYCSECNEPALMAYMKRSCRSDFCPNCGAKMDGGRGL